MAKSCTFDHANCACRSCTERRYFERREERATAACDDEAAVIAELLARQAQLRLPMAGLAHCADQPARLNDPAPFQLEILL